MVNESDPLSKALSRPDYIHNVQYETREVPIPRFGKPQEIRGGNTRPVRSIAFSCNGKKVATGCDSRGLRIWDVREKMDAATSFSLPLSGEKQSPHGGHVTCLAWSPLDPNILLSGCKSSTTGSYVVVWDITKPKSPIAALELPADTLQISFHPNGSHFTVVCPRFPRDEVFFFHRTSIDGADKWVQRKDIIIGGAGEDLGAEEINSLRFSNSGQYICAVGNDGSLNAWSYPLEPLLPAVSSLKRERDTDDAGPSRVPSPKRRNGASSPAPNGEAEEDNQGEDVEMGDESKDAGETEKDGSGGLGLTIHTSTTSTSTAVSRSAATVPPPTTSQPSSPSSNRSNQVEKSSSSQISHTAPQQLKRIKHSVVHSAALLALGLDPTGRFIAIGGQDALLSLFSTKDWICARTNDTSTGAIRYIGFSPDGEMIAFSGDEQAIFIISVHSGQLITKLPIPYTINSLAWHPTKNWLAYSIISKGAIVWYMVQQE